MVLFLCDGMDGRPGERRRPVNGMGIPNGWVAGRLAWDMGVVAMEFYMFVIGSCVCWDF